MLRVVTTGASLAMSYTLTLAAIALADALAIVSPGPAFLLVSRTAASRPRAVGVATGVGVAAAIILWALAATFGVAALMTRFATLFGAIQLAGGAYLIWLGLAAWRDAAPKAEPDAEAGAAAPARLSRAVLTGFSLTLGNPKVVLFFSSIFVTLLPAHAPFWVRLAAVGIVAMQETCWYILVACAFSHARMRAGYARIRSVLDRAIGAIFVALGARIVALAQV